MLNSEVTARLNTQINKEFYSAYLYMGFSTWFADQGLDGFSSWYGVQAQEERDHAMLFSQYLQNNGVRPVLEAIEKPEQDYSDGGAVLREGLVHEQYVTGLIHGIYECAGEAKDFRTMQFLDWFVKEQGEEEKNAEDIIRKWTLYGADPRALYALDNEMSTRIYAPPSLVL